MAEIAVIGGNGFIGRALVQELEQRGNMITAFDRFSGDTLPTFTNKIRSIQGDFLNRADLARAVKGMDVVIHALSTTTPLTAQSDPTLDVRTNVLQSIELFDECVSAGIKRVIFLSTGGAIYGQQSQTLLSENTIPLPVSPYAIGKLAIENYLRYFSATRGLRSTVLRISNPYGPGQRPGRAQGLIPIALRAVAEGRPVHRFGDGSMVRDYLHVADLARMISEVVMGQPRHHIYNLSSGRGASVSDVLDVIQDVTGLPLELETIPVPATFVHRAVLDSSRFTAEFSIKPIISLRDGVASTWKEIVDNGAHSGDSGSSHL